MSFWQTYLQDDTNNAPWYVTPCGYAHPWGICNHSANGLPLGSGGTVSPPPIAIGLEPEPDPKQKLRALLWWLLQERLR